MAYPTQSSVMPYSVAPWVLEFDFRIRKSMPPCDVEHQDHGRPWRRIEQSSNILSSPPQSSEGAIDSSSNSNLAQPQHTASTDRQQGRPQTFWNPSGYPSHIFESERQELDMIASGSGRQERVQTPPGLVAPQGQRMGILPQLQNGFTHCFQRPPSPPPWLTRTSSPPPPAMIDRPSSTELTRRRLSKAKQERKRKEDAEYNRGVRLRRDGNNAERRSVSFSDRVISFSSLSSDESSWGMLSSVYRLACDWENIDEDFLEGNTLTDAGYEGDQEDAE